MPPLSEDNTSDSDIPEDLVCAKCFVFIRLFDMHRNF